MDFALTDEQRQLRKGVRRFGENEMAPIAKEYDREEGDDWVIDGTEMWITNGSVADYFMLTTGTDPEASERFSGFSRIVVGSDRDGFPGERIAGKTGIRASNTAELLLDGVRVPEENLLGTRGAGFLELMQFFDDTHITVATQRVGSAKGAAERTPD